MKPCTLCLHSDMAGVNLDTLAMTKPKAFDMSSETGCC